MRRQRVSAHTSQEEEEEKAGFPLSRIVSETICKSQHALEEEEEEEEETSFSLGWVSSEPISATARPRQGSLSGPPVRGMSGPPVRSSSGPPVMRRQTAPADCRAPDPSIFMGDDDLSLLSSGLIGDWIGYYECFGRKVDLNVRFTEHDLALRTAEGRDEERAFIFKAFIKSGWNRREVRITSSPFSNSVETDTMVYTGVADEEGTSIAGYYGPLGGRREGSFFLEHKMAQQLNKDLDHIFDLVRTNSGLVTRSPLLPGENQAKDIPDLDLRLNLRDSRAQSSRF